MKHVFIINSHTTFLTVCGVINYLHLDSSEIILLKIRNYKEPHNSFNYRVVNITPLDEDFKKNLYKSYKNRQRVVKELDNFIEKSIKDAFVFYAPHFASALFQCFYTNPHCQEAAFVQEGAIPQKKAFIYDSLIKIRLKHFLLDKLYLRNNRIWTTHYWYLKDFFVKQKRVESYSINHVFFKYLPCHNNIVKWPHIDLSLQIEKESIFFVFDGFVNNNIVERDNYMHACEKLISKYAGINNNILKFHPAQDKEEREYISKIFKDRNAGFTILDDSVPLEIIISSYNSLTFVGFSSSILYFAFLYHHTVKSGCEFLLGSPLYKDYRNRYGVKLFDENISLLR